MSRTVVIMVVSWLCIFSVSAATLGESCNETVDCTATVETCTNGNCECSSGYFNVSNVCKSSSITVSLSPQSTSVVYGSAVTLTATVTSEVPLNASTTFKWLKGPADESLTEFVLTPSKYIQTDVGQNQVTLTIQSVNFNDTSAYQVEVSNLAGTTSKSDQVSLNVTGEKPTVVVPGTITETATTVTIHCNARVTQDSPALTAVYWLFKGAILSSTDNTKYSGGNLNTQSLTINNITSTDAGEYRCVATNLVGSSTSSQLVNLAPPSNVAVSQQPGGSINHGSSVTFTGSYSSAPLNVKIIKWQIINGSSITDIVINGKYNGSSVTGLSPKLVINPVKFIDETSYQLEVRNGVGSNLSSFRLSIKDEKVLSDQLGYMFIFLNDEFPGCPDLLEEIILRITMTVQFTKKTIKTCNGICSNLTTHPVNPCHHLL